jgi:hypothetical protein
MVVQYRSSELSTTSDQLSGANPTLPSGFVRSDCQLVRVSHQRHAEQQWFHGKLFQPAVVRKLRVTQCELLKAL